MDQHAGDLTDIAIVLSIATLSGLALTRLRQPAIVGYILAGVALGPSGLQLIGRSEHLSLLAELGVIMLLFLIGMELSVRALVSVLRVACLCVALQIAAALSFALGLGWLLDKPLPLAILFGFIVSLSSTAVAIKMLEDLGELRTDVGRVTVGVLIAQDLCVVPMLLVLEALGQGQRFDIIDIVKIAGAVAVLAAVIWGLNRRQRLSLPAAVSLKGQGDLIPLAALAVCFTAATISGAMGLSAAFGAFLAGLVIGNSTARPVVIRATLPIQTVLLVLFFLSIGLLLDLTFVWENVATVLAWVAVIVLVKTLVNVVALHALGEPWRRAFPAGVIMSQIGEFSFVLAAVGVGSGILDAAGYRLAIAVIAISLLTSPLWQASARRFHAAAAQGLASARDLLREAYDPELTFARSAGRIGRRLALAVWRSGAAAFRKRA
jgi:CPA2 family monovalent cation:H+ antiporter-2